ncbi:hypothetical protein R6Q57_007766 [Mikania cordata]
MLWKKISLEQPTVPVSGVSRYLTPLWVSGNEEPRDGPCQSDSSSSQSIITDTGFKLQKMNLSSYHQVSVSCKIRAALKLLTFREQHVIVQFWSAREVGKHQLLTTIDQPFGVGVASEALCSYRRVSEHNVFLVDKDHEEDLSPPARVFRRGLPEWTPDLDNYEIKDFPQVECAIHCDLHGYLALPVFDSSTGLCVGVLELLTSVKYTSYAFEVQQVHKALKAEHLSSPEVFDHPIPKFISIYLHALYERKQIELDKIFVILKNVCDIRSLPLAQEWTVSPSSSFVSNNKVIEKTCSSFDTRCIGKACMSSANLPFHVRDMGMWQFRKACREQHLDKHSAFVGKALLARGSCYVENAVKIRGRVGLSFAQSRLRSSLLFRKQNLRQFVRRKPQSTMANDGDEANTIASGLQTVPTQQSPQKSSMVNDGDATEMLPISQLEEQSVQKDQTQKNEEPIQANDKDDSDSDKPIKEFLKPNKERKRKLKLKAKKVDKLKEAGSKRKIETSQQAEKVKVKKLMGNIEKSEENQSPYFEYTGQKIFMRCSPANLINFLEKLNEDQKKAVKEMGFGEVLCLKLHTIPTAFGYWLLKNYNPQTDIQNIGSSQFKITPDFIHLVFGIPNGKITVHEKFRPNSNDAVVSEWRSQFGTDIPKKISMKDFAQHLTTRNDSGRMFKLNFLVIHGMVARMSCLTGL